MFEVIHYCVFNTIHERYILRTLKTGTPVEDADPILKLLRRLSRPEIQLGVGIHSE